MKVLSKKEIAEELSGRVSMEVDRASRGVDAAVALMTGKLREGFNLRLESFAEIKLSGDGESWSLPSKDATSAIADSLEGSSEEAEGFLSALLKVLGDSLLNGDRVEIDRFISLRIAEQKASVQQDTGGGRVITPARKVISFSIDPTLKSEMGEDQKLRFTPDPALRERIARLKTSTILLVVPEEDYFAKTLVFHFRKAGWDVNIVTDCQEALNRIESGETYQVILDDPMPDSQKLLERIKCHVDTARVPCIVMMPSGSDPNKTSGFRICADQSIVQPFEVKALLDKAETELARVAEEEAIFRQEVYFQFATIDKLIDQANSLGAQIFQRSGLDDEGQVAVCAAFREAIGNAAQHGNRHRRDKVIDILYLLDNEKITVSVTDQGEGFDHRLYTQRGAGGNALAAARERHQQGRLGGLGIMLMMKCTDRLEYNEVGNSVTLTKMLVKPS
ncbi:MAG: ATP-binding protein [Planctomycetota bacterium]|jgi:anti-sigma regulatory factor (Ser/Thr protein kinase)/nucleoid DNA-binding protein/CheY-like chemotaxis protein